MIVLGIETSCDETAAAIVADDRTILSNVVLSQLDEHRPYGGVVPEIAARAHLDYLDCIIRQALDEADIELSALDGIAATGGPGLIGGVMVGVMTAKAIAAVHDLPFLAVNHLEGHALTARLTDAVEFPYLLLLVSGGHCQLLAVEDVGSYTRLGGTIDDAIGEAFDKTAKLLDLGYPGGPAVEAAAAAGDPTRFKLPRPLSGRPGCDFSFSGLKTAVRHAAAKLPAASQPNDALSPADAADLAAGFQAAVGDVLVDRCAHAFDAFAQSHAGAIPPLVVAGGVAANLHLRACLNALCEERQTRLVAPPPALCTDNAAMIAWAGLEHLRRGARDGLDFAPRPRWPLDETKVATA
ncbi:MAG: tRNA (adenosine(37)-N6)-threonylcarbamoyltransferase complex transferase subunit TsaD [Alphaproteobacteria bacterium]|nr:tRNA (adenosine(37)-N6)-threonylcarbamoyltransferase complex transferase subunit TsaD [Alphaproteobacteria bacterium]